MMLGLTERPIPWLQDTGTAVMIAVVATAWRSVPLAAILLLAALKTIPRALYRAGQMDGATGCAAVPLHHPARDQEHPARRRDPPGDPVAPGLRPALPADRRRPGPRDDGGELLHLRADGPEPELRLLVGAGDRPVPGHPALLVGAPLAAAPRAARARQPSDEDDRTAPRRPRRGRDRGSAPSVDAPASRSWRRPRWRVRCSRRSRSGAS